MILTDGVDGVTDAFVFFFNEQKRGALVEPVGTSTEETGTGAGWGEGSRTHFLFFDELAEDRLVRSTEDAPAETRTEFGDVDKTTSGTASPDKSVAVETIEPDIGASWSWTGVTGSIAGDGTDTVA